MSNDSAITVWNATDAVAIPPGESAPEKIVPLAGATLSKRDLKSIEAGFKSESYEMVSTFVWIKAAAALKSQVATLGMEFVGEMLKRPDLDEDSDPSTSIADHEVIMLAEDLGMVTETQGLKLKHALELVSHYAQLDQQAAELDPMQKEDAVALLKTCVTAILGQPRLNGAMQFADFRKRLGTGTLKTDDPSIELVRSSPYFFVRTTLSVLLSMVKTAKGAELEHALGNTMVIVPCVWPRLRGPERWQVGQAYAEVSADGNRFASAGLKKALLDVHGFDYVPESLRSNTFTEAAARVLSAHFAGNNFYNEAAPMAVLAKLGTAIPMPAFAKCMEATLAVWLGNHWGHSFSAEQDAKVLLDLLRPVQWEYYLNECLPGDGTILAKLACDDKPVQRWCALIEKHIEPGFRAKDKAVQDLVDATRGQANPGMVKAVQRRAQLLGERARSRP
jgi:hypothetical protein